MAWYDSAWTKRKPMTLTGGTSGAQTDYQMKCTVTYDSDMRADFGDLRFTKLDGATILNAWLESKTDSTSAVIVVETDTPANGVDADVYMYYGNSDAGRYWDIAATFVFGDDFAIPWNKYKHDSNPLAEYPFMRVIKDGATWHMYYMDIPNFNHATSTDGINWTDDTANNPVLTPSASGWDSDRVWGLTPIKVGTNDWHALYTGRQGSIDKIGHATSTDGVNWTKDTVNNPVIEATQSWEEDGPETGSILQVGSTFYLWYHQTGGTHRDCGVASSTNWTSWSKDAANPIFPGTTGEFYHAFSPGIFEYNGTYYIVIAYYDSGKDFAKLRLYEDSSPTFYSASRTDRGYVISGNNSWEANDMDTFRVSPGNPIINGAIYGYYVAQASSGGVWNVGLVQIPTSVFPVSTFAELGKWTVEDGSWSISGDEQLYANGVGAQALIRTASYNSFADNIMECEWEFVDWTVGGREGALVRYQDVSNYYAMWLMESGSTGGAKAVAIEDRVSGSWGTMDYAAQSFTTGTPYDIAYRADSNNLKAFFEGSEKVSTTRTDFSSGAIGFRTWFADIYIDNVRVRKYVANPATYAFGSEEDGPEGSPYWYYKMLRSR